MNIDQAFLEADRLSRLLDGGIEALRSASKEVAEAEMAYRKAKSEAWIRVPRDTDGQRNWTAGRREAWVDSETAPLRYARDLAEGKRSSALEAIRARRTQVSMLQSMLNANRAEAEFARTGPA